VHRCGTHAPHLRSVPHARLLPGRPLIKRLIA
jgi:hypothetical protein